MRTPIVLSTSPAGVVLPIHRTATDLPPHELRFFEPGSRELTDHIAEADFVLGDWTGTTRLDAKALHAARHCRLIVQPTAGHDSIDTETAAALGIPVANIPGANARAVSEWTVMAMLMLAKNVVRNHHRTADGEWPMVEAAAEGVRDLADCTVGIVGLGRIGRNVARLLHAFGVEPIHYWHRRPVAPDPTAPATLEYVPDLDDLLTRCEIVTLHIPLTPDTRGLIDSRRLRLLGPAGVLINTARGGIVDETALHTALRNREIKAAALDVFSQEPPPTITRWSTLDNVLLSPHLAGSTIEARHAMVRRALTALAEGLRGELPASVVNGVTALRSANVPGRY
ncbi:2-hydroxyacid dehydrogenase [Nocardia sp. BMG51109]|uniref:2-hydroxyacid dehydrogenase n=1 Tax=Nocardia sp. BMG51109 TaxID=1056816 RepID=UPI0004660DB2|nr:NAD(P)-dependent oxidoreductase [Nocardia sp. BMG51109]